MKGTLSGARWSGLAVILGSVLALLSRPDERTLSALFHPIDFLSGLLSGTGAASASDGAAQAAAALAFAITGGGSRPELTAGAGVDLLLTVQVLATGLLIGLLLAIPVALLTAWFLRYGPSDQQIPHL